MTHLEDFLRKAGKALPTGTERLRGDGYVWVKQGNGKWKQTGRRKLRSKRATAAINKDQARMRAATEARNKVEDLLADAMDFAMAQGLNEEAQRVSETLTGMLWKRAGVEYGAGGSIPSHVASRNAALSARISAVQQKAAPPVSEPKKQTPKKRAPRAKSSTITVSNLPMRVRDRIPTLGRAVSFLKDQAGEGIGTLAYRAKDAAVVFVSMGKRGAVKQRLATSDDLKVLGVKEGDLSK